MSGDGCAGAGVTKVLALVAEKGGDYASNTQPPSFPHGLDCEAFTFEWLQRAAREAQLPSEREHVTPYMRTHALARRECLEGPGGKSVQYRWTLDDESDLRFLRELFCRLPTGPAGYDYRIPLAIVDSDPELVAFNAGHDRYAWLKDAPPESERLSGGGIDLTKSRSDL
jgi:spore coat polysaccharide biosynthesis protein SpsF